MTFTKFFSLGTNGGPTDRILVYANSRNQTHVLQEITHISRSLVCKSLTR